MCALIEAENGCLPIFATALIFLSSFEFLMLRIGNDDVSCGRSRLFLL